MRSRRSRRRPHETSGCSRQPAACSSSLAPAAGRASPDFMGESWTADGVETGGQFGYAVAGAGDVNGDGYDDLVVGAPRVDNGVYRAGAAFVYHGGPGGLAPAPTWDIAGSDTGERLGHAVAGAGDVNGDGFDDLIVGAYRYNSGLPEAGTAYVYYGSLYGLSTLPDWSATGDLEWAHFGYAVAAAGDVNGDGYDDVIVGARWYGAGAANGGAAFLYLGSELGLAATPAWSATGDQAQMALGTTVAGLGDVNGDGFDDIIVGAPYFDAPEEDAGAVFGYYGAPAGPGPTPDWVVTGPQADALLGAAIGAAGDVNGDGFDDAVLGAPQADGVIPDVGMAQIHLGSPSGLSAVANWTVTGGQALSSFGDCGQRRGRRQPRRLRRCRRRRLAVRISINRKKAPSFSTSAPPSARVPFQRGTEKATRRIPSMA